MLNFWAIKIYYRNYVAGICRSYHESSDCFECAKKSLLKWSYQKKKIFAKILQPQKILKLKLSLPKTPLVIPVTWNLQYPPWGWGCCLEPGTLLAYSIFLALQRALSWHANVSPWCHCIGWLMLFIQWVIFFLLLGNVNPNYWHRASGRYFMQVTFHRSEYRSPC